MRRNSGHITSFPGTSIRAFRLVPFAGAALAAVLFLAVMSGIHVHTLAEIESGSADECPLCLQLDHLAFGIVSAETPSAPVVDASSDDAVALSPSQATPVSNDPARAPPVLS